MTDETIDPAEHQLPSTPSWPVLPDASADANQSTKESLGRRSGRWRRRLKVAALALVVIGLFAGGAAFGWWLRGDGEPPPTVAVTVDRPVNVATGTAAGEMPDLVGSTVAEAQSALTTLGVPGDQVVVETVPAAGEPGRVVGQEPAAGGDLGAGVVLHVSTEATVPAVVGAVEADARELLARLGAQVVVERVFDPAATEGVVLAVAPAVGAPLVDRVTLTVAAPPSAVFLAALVPADGSCSSGQEVVGGQTFSDSLACGTGRRGASTVDYALSGRATVLEGALGLSDDDGTGPPLRFRVVGDGRVLVDETVAFGEARPVRFSVEGVIRLVISVEWTDPDAEVDDSPVGVFGSMRVVGSPDDIDALAAGDG